MFRTPASKSAASNSFLSEVPPPDAAREYLRAAGLPQHLLNHAGKQLNVGVLRRKFGYGTASAARTSSNSPAATACRPRPWFAEIRDDGSETSAALRNDRDSANGPLSIVLRAAGFIPAGKGTAGINTTAHQNRDHGFGVLGFAFSLSGFPLFRLLSVLVLLSFGRRVSGRRR